ncbi:MAG: c-type cytochrome [Pirellulales bacterium]
MLKPLSPVLLMRCLLLCLPLSFAASATAAEAGVPEWIWATRPAQPNQTALFRKTFDVTAPVKSARLVISCDNELVAFLNGRRVARSDQWQQPVGVNVGQRLREGENVLVVRGANDASNTAGLLAVLTLELEDGQTQTVVTDATWKATAEADRGWQRAGFDDSGWSSAVALGKLGAAPWGALALDGSPPPGEQATSTSDIQTLDGFRVELLYSVPKDDQGSWVSMTPDSKGRLICSDQYGGLFRITPGADQASTRVEPLSVEIGQSQGMLFVGDDLYVTVNGDAAEGSGFYRVRDTDGDDQFDEVKLLKRLRGGGEHGPHAIRQGPDGALYVIAGNHTQPPDALADDSPHRNFAEDLLLKRNPDGGGHATGIMAPAGWIARTDAEGESWELFCAGFRNPYDMDFNMDGELFTYDADMEWDTGAPWYRPTRINHAVSGGEFGWRYGTGKWPEYYADSLGAVVDIGLGSPTGIAFGTGAKFPARYQRALFILDWTYGKIYAVHLRPDGASYTGSFETLVAGRPLPVTDVAINPADGALYFTIGGRRTQSGLYRVTYTGSEPTDAAGPVEDEAASQARALRHNLESFHGRTDPAAVETAWPHLNSTDRYIRYAARIAVEHQPVDSWQEKALAETRTIASTQALLALTRCGPESLQSEVLAKLNGLPLTRMNEQQTLEALRAYQLAFIRMGGKTSADVTSVVEKLNPLYPGESLLVNRELCRMLVYLEAPAVIERSLQMLQDARTQQDQMFYVFVLRNLSEGWTLDQRRAFFSWLNLAEEKYQGGNSFTKFVQQIRRDALETMPDEQRQALEEVIEGRSSVEVVQLETTRQYVHNWQMEDLAPLLDQVETGRSFERGKLAYDAAQCGKCHRFAGDGGATGPDITGVGNRFSPEYLLEALIVPEKVISDQYQNTVLATGDGEVIVGRIIEENDDVIRIRTSPFATELTEIRKDNIEQRQPASSSEMPTGLINVLTQEEILDMIAYLRSGGNPQDMGN